MAGPTLRVPTEQPWHDPDGQMPVEVQRFLQNTATILSPTGTGTIYTSTDGGATTELMSLASLLVTGMVRNVVVGTTSTPTTNATSAFADTTLTATITPSVATSTVLVLVFQNGVSKDTGNTSVQLRLRRGTSTLQTFAGAAGGTGSVATNNIGTVATAYRDSPASIAALTYTTQLASSANVANATVQTNSETSAMVLIEVIG